MKNYTLTLLFVFLFVGLKAQEEIKVGSATREMIVFVPSGIQDNRPLVISMHGMNQTMYDQKNQTQFQSVAQANNFVLVFPQSNGSQWELWGDNDINFILAIIDEIHSRYAIDRDRVYLSGFSMGGMMSYYAATRIANKIAAFAPVGGFLMGGPNTNSSRPVPIIHVHGADDNYVPHSRVQECMDAWIIRNGCQATPVVTKPYPADQPASQSSRKYWGPGEEGVELVFISVAGVGHWYSDNPKGIFTSQEIWNFCKKFSLKDGVPELKYASVTDNEPSQILLELSQPIVADDSYTGFTVKIDGVVGTVNDVLLSDTNKLAINLNGNILKDNVVTLSYANGNVVSVNYEKKLTDFFDAHVDNLLKGSSPKIYDASTLINGDELIVRFNKKMQIPTDVSAFVLTAEYNGHMNVPVLQSSFFNNDSTTLLFSLGEKVYRDYKLSITYTGNNFISADDGLLKAFSAWSVKNNSNGLPVHLVSGEIATDGITLSLEFSKAMTLTSTQSNYFDLKVNGANVGFNSYTVSDKTIHFILKRSVHIGDTVTMSINHGEITSADNGPLESFSTVAIANKVSAPEWITIPGKIEAENYTFKYGMQAETTGDTGGGQNLGYIGDGDWVEYAIENKVPQTAYQILFRLAATSASGVIDYFIDDVYAGRVNAPNTGNWQVYQSVKKNIDIPEGKHYLKLLVTKAGFNLNYVEIGESVTGIGSLAVPKFNIYPNPVSNELNVDFAGFKHRKIEVFDVSGKMLIEKKTSAEPLLQIPVALPNGVYTLRILNEENSDFKRFIVENK
jgi:uncharacterized repeat protein (TIGR02059 family)